MNNLGNIYSSGIGIEPDHHLALYYYTMAANLDDTGAMANLGSLYLNLIGVENNQEKACEWYRKAAEGGL